MLSIKYNNTWFDLYPGSTITMELNNPAFDDDFLKGNYSFPFKVPLSSKNRQLLGFPDEPGSTVDFNVALIVDLFIDGLLLFPQGELRLKTVFQNYADVFLLVGISTFANYANNTKVADVVTFYQELHAVDNYIDDPDYNAFILAKASLDETVDSLPYIFFPVINDGHYDGAVMPSNPFIDHITAYNLFYDDRFHCFDTHTMMPFFYNTYVLREIFKNYPVIENIFETDLELKTLALLNTFGLDKYRDDGLKLPFRNIEAKNHVPDLYIGDYLLALKKMLCLYVHQNPFDNRVYINTMNSLLDSNEVIDFTAITIAMAEISQIGVQGIKYTPEAGGDSEISNIQSTKSERVVQFNSFMETGDVWLNERENKFYKVAVPDPGGISRVDDFFGFAYGDFYIDPARFEVSTKFSGACTTVVELYFQALPGDTHDFFQYPIINMQGSYLTQEIKDGDGNVTTPAKAINNPNCMKLVFWRGMQRSFKYSRDMPMGDSNNRYSDTYHGIFPRTGNYSLAYYGSAGLHEIWWKKYIAFRDSAKTIKAEIKFDLVTLLNFDFRKKISIQGQHYFIKKLSLQLPLNKPVQAELWKYTGI